ncbi:Hypothetical protein NTJ_02533 [Nesidiocoris tenuis]|uniref:Uncharacterized protein n=1 Tax=Nesidiocoris tenuis TaxID=355587 RepID=A0ABN7ABN3_9HEMI|nr:Hypothetical protein NTJ_02533 [Nesidiocoris tenuis]
MSNGPKTDPEVGRDGSQQLLFQVPGAPSSAMMNIRVLPVGLVNYAPSQLSFGVFSSSNVPPAHYLSSDYTSLACYS